VKSVESKHGRYPQLNFSHHEWPLFSGICWPISLD
jgi:hypothetical protein